MTTRKVLGCGGRYSAYTFLPCHLCPIKSEHVCGNLQIEAGTAHYEWFTDLEGRAKWRATRPEKEEQNDDVFSCDCESCVREQKTNRRPEVVWAAQ